ncbi:hypothetical protein DFP73DRAFT_593316 [Morchella snyderi]|nr:hypothetical protein DFP73DRAFT_593316 [Morchella snyderi]
MHSTTLISFLLLLLTPLFAVAQDTIIGPSTTAPAAGAESTSFSSTTTVRTTVTSTQVTFVTMTGVPPSSSTSVAISDSSISSSSSTSSTATISKPSLSATGNGTAIATGSPSAVPFVGAAPGAFRASAGMGAVVIAAAVWLL